MEGPCKELVQDDGQVELKLTIDEIEGTSQFKVSKGLGYDIVMGIDLLTAFGMIQDNENLIWMTPKGVEHPCYTLKHEIPYKIQSVATISGLKNPSELQKQKIDEMLIPLYPLRNQPRIWQKSPPITLMYKEQDS